MKRFNTIIKPLIGILAIVPFGFIGMLVVGAMASKSGDTESGIAPTASVAVNYPTLHKTVEVDGLEYFLSGGGTKERAGHFIAPWVSDLFSYVSKFDPRIIRPVPCCGSGLSGIREQLYANRG